MAAPESVVTCVEPPSLIGCCRSRSRSSSRRRRPTRISLVLSHWNSFLGECVDDGPISIHHIDISPPPSPPPSPTIYHNHSTNDYNNYHHRYEDDDDDDYSHHHHYQQQQQQQQQQQPVLPTQPAVPLARQPSTTSSSLSSSSSPSASVSASPPSPTPLSEQPSTKRRQSDQPQSQQPQPPQPPPSPPKQQQQQPLQNYQEHTAHDKQSPKQQRQPLSSPSAPSSASSSEPQPEVAHQHQHQYQQQQQFVPSTTNQSNQPQPQHYNHHHQQQQQQQQPLPYSTEQQTLPQTTPPPSSPLPKEKQRYTQQHQEQQQQQYQPLPYSTEQPPPLQTLPQTTTPPSPPPEQQHYKQNQQQQYQPSPYSTEEQQQPPPPLSQTTPSPPPPPPPPSTTSPSQSQPLPPPSPTRADSAIPPTPLTSPEVEDKDYDDVYDDNDDDDDDVGNQPPHGASSVVVTATIHHHSNHNSHDHIQHHQRNNNNNNDTASGAIPSPSECPQFEDVDNSACDHYQQYNNNNHNNNNNNHNNNNHNNNNENINSTRDQREIPSRYQAPTSPTPPQTPAPAPTPPSQSSSSPQSKTPSNHEDTFHQREPQQTHQENQETPPPPPSSTSTPKPPPQPPSPQPQPPSPTPPFSIVKTQPTPRDRSVRSHDDAIVTSLPRHENKNRDPETAQQKDHNARSPRPRDEQTRPSASRHAYSNHEQRQPQHQPQHTTQHHTNQEPPTIPHTSTSHHQHNDRKFDTQIQGRQPHPQNQERQPHQQNQERQPRSQNQERQPRSQNQERQPIQQNQERQPRHYNEERQPHPLNQDRQPRQKQERQPHPQNQERQPQPQNQERQPRQNQERQPQPQNQERQPHSQNQERQPLPQNQKSQTHSQNQDQQSRHQNQERQPHQPHPQIQERQSHSQNQDRQKKPHPQTQDRKLPLQSHASNQPAASQPPPSSSVFQSVSPKRETRTTHNSTSSRKHTDSTSRNTTSNKSQHQQNPQPLSNSQNNHQHPTTTTATTTAATATTQISKPKPRSLDKATPTPSSSAPPHFSSTPPTSSKMNHTDSKQMNGSPAMSNHVGGSGDPSGVYRKFSKTDSVDDNKREGPITIPADIVSRKKDLTKEQVRDKVTQAVACLKSMDEYHHGDAMKIQKAIGDVYWDYSSQRVEIGDLLSQLGYGDITVTMLKQMNSLGIFKNDDIWFPTYYTYNTCWNYSDASEVLARGLAESGAVKLMTLNLGHKPYIDNMHSKNVYYVLKASLSTLHNIARCTGVKHHFQEIKTAEVIMPLISSNDEFLKSIAMLTLAYIVEEDENAKLIDDTNTIKNIVQWIQKALENKQKRRFRGFTPWELAQGLAKLAVNDGNKARIVEEGALQSFLIMLRHTDPKEQATSAECVWNLAFDKSVRQRIVDHEDLVPALEDLKDSEDPAVRKNVRGALWVIKGDNDPSTSVSRPHTSEGTKNHIFISYSWNEKELVQKIHASLQALGFRIWVDWEQMGGSTLQAMAEAVENSAVVLVCMSERYKQSPNCRTEAEYTFQLRKDYIPLMMQRRYRPDGWLGAILGAKLFFDFSGKHPYEKSLQGLIKELRGRGKHSSSSIDEPDGSRDVVATSCNSTAVTLLDHSPPTPSGARPSNGSIGVGGGGGGGGGGGACVAMSNENVETWLVSKGLQRFTPTFSQIDGQLIWQLKKMRETAPEFYHSSLERQFGMSLIDILRFNAALDSLH